MAFDPVTLEKNGLARVAQSASALVRMQWDGWRPVGQDEPADVVELVADDEQLADLSQPNPYGGLN